MTTTLRHGLHYPWASPPAEAEAIEVASGVLWMRLPLPMKLDHVNVYALEESDGWTIIDTGLGSQRGKLVWRQLLSGPLSGKPIRRLVVTHHHPDHMGLAGWFQSQFHAVLVTTRTAWLFARMLTLDEQAVPVPESIAFYEAAGMNPRLLSARKTERPFNFADVVAPMPLGFERIKEGDEITMGGRRWHVRTGNGHAPEQATFWSKDDNLVIAGDQILPSISPNIGVYPTEPMADPLAEWLESCERLSQYARPEHLVLGGHKLPFSGLPFRMNQLMENHRGALLRLLDALHEPKSAAECFLPIFKREIGDSEYGLALVEAVAHLNHLYLSGQVTRQLRPDGAWVYTSLPQS